MNQIIGFGLVFISVYFMFWVLAVFLKKKGGKTYTKKEIAKITKKTIYLYNVPLIFKFIFWLNLVIFIILCSLPMVIIPTQIGNIQKILFATAGTYYFLGVSNIIPIMIQMFASLFIGVSVGMIFCIPLYNFFPQFEIYDMQFNVDRQGFYNYNTKKNIVILATLFKVSFVVLPLFLIIGFFGLYDYTKADDNGIFQRYFFNESEFKWNEVESAKLVIDYNKKKVKGKYYYYINPKMFLTLKNNKEISIWRDNGLVKPTEEELFWLFDKIKKENIKLEVFPLPDEIRNNPYYYEDYWNRIDPVLQRVLLNSSIQ